MHSTFLRVLEILLYTLLNAIPYHFCVLYMFRERLRYPLGKTCLLLVPCTLLELLLNLSVGLGFGDKTGYLNIIWSGGYTFSYLWAVKVPIGKTSFMMMVMLNLNNFIIVASKWLEGMLFPGLAMERFHISNSLTMAITELLILAPCFITFRKRYRPALQQESNDFLWRFLWAVPLTFYFLWHYHVHFSDVSSLEVATDTHSLIFLLVVNAGAYLIYYLVLRMVVETAKNAALRNQNQQLALQSLQFENLQERMAETRKANHDLRHHITVMQGYLESGDYSGLGQYFRTLKTLTPSGNLHFCAHSPLNMLLAYFAQSCQENGIRYTFRVNVPAAIPVPDSDLTVLLGNLVENAVDACRMQTQGEKALEVCGSIQGGRLLFTVDNSFSGPLRQDRTGAYLSTKHAGPGIGLSSVRDIVQRHGGQLQIRQEKGRFWVSFYLQL